jgi:16S rRNA (cytosine1402-N4)-methyltransferase
VGDEGLTDTPEGVGRGGNHVPVLLKEAIDFLAVRRGGIYIDATVGLGGHSYEIARRLGAPGRLIGFDKDPAALERAGVRLAVGRSPLEVGERPKAGPSTARDDSQSESSRLARDDKALGTNDWPTVELRHGSFTQIAEDRRLTTVDGILADLGVSSFQLNDPARGFSFQAEGPLDMRMNTQSGRTAEQVVNHIDERELADVIYEFGEERRSRRIARAIVRSRPIRTTAQLAEIVSAATRPMKLGRRPGPFRLSESS